MARSTGLVAGLVLFVVLATLNSAGYRYGASDQAFYAPAVIRALHPDYYPHDAPLIDAQARLTAVDEVTAGRVRAVLYRRARALRTGRHGGQPIAGVLGADHGHAARRVDSASCHRRDRHQHAGGLLSSAADC